MKLQEEILRKKSDYIKTIENIKNLYSSRGKVIIVYNDYAQIIFEAKYKAKYGEGHKILNSKQMLQRLPMALSQVKANNNRQNLSN